MKPPMIYITEQSSQENSPMKRQLICKGKPSLPYAMMFYNHQPSKSENSVSKTHRTAEQHQPLVPLNITVNTFSIRNLHCWCDGGRSSITVTTGSTHPRQNVLALPCQVITSAINTKTRRRLFFNQKRQN